MREINVRNFDYKQVPEQLLTPEIVQMIASIHEHKGRQELFLEANMLATIPEAPPPTITTLFINHLFLSYILYHEKSRFYYPL